MTKSVKAYPGKNRENWEEFREFPGKFPLSTLYSTNVSFWLGDVKSIFCSDKTGTLTTNDMAVQSVYTSDDILRDSLTPLIDHAEPEFKNSEEIHIQSLMEIAVLCNNATIGKLNII